MTPNHPAATAMVATVAAIYGIDAELIWSRQRGPTLVEARHLAWWALREKTGWSYPELGRALGVDHSTVLHGVRNTCGKVRDGTGTSFLKTAVEFLKSTGLAGAKPVAEGVGKLEVCPPPLILSPSEISSQSPVLSGSSSALSSGSKEPVSKPARRRKTEPETEPPEHLAPTARQVEIANERNIDLPVEIERYLSHHRAKGNKRARWTAGLTTWLLSPYPKALKGGGSGPGGKPPPGANFARLKARAEQLELEEKRNAAQ